MAQIRLPENIAKLAQVTGGTLKLPASVVNIGARQYQTTSDTVLNVAVAGANGLDATMPSAASLYYVYAVVSNGALALVGSLNSTAPSGFSQYRLVGHFSSNDTGGIYQVYWLGQYDVLASTPMKNYLINGNFDFWQRGTTNGTSTGIRYLADRWRIESVGTTYSNDRVPFTPGQTAVPNEPAYNFQVALNTVVGAGNYLIVEHYIEDVRTLAGQNCTISFWAKASAPRNIGIRFNQTFGTGGSPSPGNSTSTQVVTLGTSYAKYSLTFAIPSIAGKTIGTNIGTSALYLYIWLDSGSTLNSAAGGIGQQGSATYNFASMSVVAGSVAPDKFYLAGGNMQGELAACQRFYEKSYDPDTAPGTVTSTGVINSIASGSGETDQTWMYKVTKRAQPSVTIYSPLTAATNRVSTGASDVVVSVAAVPLHSFYINSGSVLGGSGNYLFHYTADADY